MKRIGSGCAVGYCGMPEDVGYFVIFLASDASRFISGSTLVMDGGSMR